MRLAVLADIHGNLPALEAVLADLHPFCLNGVIVAGDIVSGPHPEGSLRRLLERNARMILGNSDMYLLKLHRGSAPNGWFTSHQWAFTRWVYSHLGPESMRILCSLPEQCTVSIPGTTPIRVVHGSPNRSNENLFKGPDPLDLDAAFQLIPEAALICGHSHLAWQERRGGRLAFNPGAVSAAFDGDRAAHYALLEWRSGQWMAELRRVSYDLRQVTAAFQESGLLKEGGAMARATLLSIESGQNFVVDFLQYVHARAFQAGVSASGCFPDEIWDQAEETYDWNKAIIQ